MCLWVGAIPATPNIFINSIVSSVTAFWVGIIRAIATNVFPKLKEKMPMLVIFIVALLGTAGVTVVWQGCIATSRVTTKILSLLEAFLL